MSSKESKKNGFWDSDAEKKVFDILNKLIDTEKFIVFPHQLCFKVLDMSWEKVYAYFHDQIVIKENPELAEGKRPELMHYDFVIYDKIAWRPVIIIEINGSEHIKEDRQIADIFKLNLAISKKIPLLIEDFTRYIADDKLEGTLKKDLQKKIKDATEKKTLPVYCEVCFGRLEHKYNRTSHELFFVCQNCATWKNGKQKTYSKKEILLEEQKKETSVEISFLR